MTIGPQRRQQLLAKFPAMNNEWPMDPRVNTQVRATDRAEQIINEVWQWAWQGSDPVDPASILFNPAWAPDVAERVDAASREFHRLEGEASRERALGLRPSLHYDTHDTEYDPDAKHEQGVVKFWHVGSDHVDVVRDRWHDSPNRRWTTTGYFAGLFKFLVSQLGYHDCTIHDADDACDLCCSVRLAKACSGSTKLMPVNRGTLVLLFRCCRECEALAGKIAANTYKTAVVNARVDLPRGAAIMPNPEPDVNPDAWA